VTIVEEKKMKKKEEATAAKYNGLPYWAAIINASSLLVTLDVYTSLTCKVGVYGT